MSYEQEYDVNYVTYEYEMEELDDFINEFLDVDLGGFDSGVDELKGIDLHDFDFVKHRDQEFQPIFPHT